MSDSASKHTFYWNGEKRTWVLFDVEDRPYAHFYAYKLSQSMSGEGSPGFPLFQNECLVSERRSEDESSCLERDRNN